MDSSEEKQHSGHDVSLELVFKVIENRGYQRLPNVPSMNALIYEKVKKLYVNPSEH
jgi:hypothetical protein